MRFSHIALAASAASSAFAAQSICDKYTVALLKDNTAANQYALLTLLVNTVVIGNYTGKGSPNPSLPGSLMEVPGILAPATVMGEKVSLAKYFDGSLKSTNGGGKAVAVNFLDGGGATPIINDPTSSGREGSNQYTLLTHLYQFFGVLLGCSEVGSSGFPAYQGSPSMAEVHQFMALDNAEFTYFVEQVGAAALSFGAAKADVNAVAKALVMGFGYRCAPAAAITGNTPELQAICIESDCPESPKPDCSAYPAVVEPQAVGAPMPTTGPGNGGGSPPSMPSPTALPGAASIPTAAAGMAVAAAGALAAAFL